MAITRIWQSGFETGSLDEFEGISGLGTHSVSTTQEKTGIYSYFTDPDHLYAFGFVTFPATRQIRFGAFNYGDCPTNWNTRQIFSVRSGTQLVGLYLTSAAGTPSNTLQLWVDGSIRDTHAGYGTLTWKHLALDMKIDLSAGWVKVYKDGNEIMSFVGNTGDDDIIEMRVGVLAAAGTPTYITHYWDDMYIDDTTGETEAAVVPIKHFYSLFPNGAGNYTDWTPSTGNNYECVDEIPPLDTDYVTTISGDILDSYTMNTFSLTSNQTIIAMIPTVRVKRTGSTEEIALGTRLSSTDLIGSDQIPGVSYSYLSERQIVKPGGGDWEQSDMDSIEVILKSRGTY